MSASTDSLTLENLARHNHAIASAHLPQTRPTCIAPTPSLTLTISDNSSTDSSSDCAFSSFSSLMPGTIPADDPFKGLHADERDEREPTDEQRTPSSPSVIPFPTRLPLEIELAILQLGARRRQETVALMGVCHRFNDWLRTELYSAIELDTLEVAHRLCAGGALYKPEITSHIKTIVVLPISFFVHHAEIWLASIVAQIIRVSQNLRAIALLDHALVRPRVTQELHDRAQITHWAIGGSSYRRPSLMPGLYTHVTHLELWLVVLDEFPNWLTTFCCRIPEEIPNLTHLALCANAQLPDSGLLTNASTYLREETLLVVAVGLRCPDDVWDEFIQDLNNGNNAGIVVLRCDWDVGNLAEQTLKLWDMVEQDASNESQGQEHCFVQLVSAKQTNIAFLLTIMSSDVTAPPTPRSERVASSSPSPLEIGARTTNGDDADHRTPAAHEHDMNPFPSADDGSNTIAQEEASTQALNSPQSLSSRRPDPLFLPTSSPLSAPFLSPISAVEEAFAPASAPEEALMHDDSDIDSPSSPAPNPWSQSLAMDCKHPSDDEFPFTLAPSIDTPAVDETIPHSPPPSPPFPLKRPASSAPSSPSENPYPSSQRYLRASVSKRVKMSHSQAPVSPAQGCSSAISFHPKTSASHSSARLTPKTPSYTTRMLPKTRASTQGLSHLLGTNRMQGYGVAGIRRRSTTSAGSGDLHAMGNVDLSPLLFTSAPPAPPPDTDTARVHRQAEELYFQTHPNGSWGDLDTQSQDYYIAQVRMLEEEDKSYLRTKWVSHREFISSWTNYWARNVGVVWTSRLSKYWARNVGVVWTSSAEVDVGVRCLSINAIRSVEQQSHDDIILLPTPAKTEQERQRDLFKQRYSLVAGPIENLPHDNRVKTTPGPLPRRGNQTRYLPSRQADLLQQTICFRSQLRYSDFLTRQCEICFDKGGKLILTCSCKSNLYHLDCLIPASKIRNAATQSGHIECPTCRQPAKPLHLRWALPDKPMLLRQKKRRLEKRAARRKQDPALKKKELERQKQRQLKKAEKAKH
ncbi:hypothetical protein R3P38DRAFT_2759609 [Favolaschia claudopus]|uniref:RING-type domain-containing protein n=1 Tax=Favolaschia claudopus TaxID=2862362 RepID=A0AAW0DZ40_9AGAR